jgi:hypothetical protein
LFRALGRCGVLLCPFMCAGCAAITTCYTIGIGYPVSGTFVRSSGEDFGAGRIMFEVLDEAGQTRLSGEALTDGLGAWNDEAGALSGGCQNYLESILGRPRPGVTAPRPDRIRIVFPDSGQQLEVPVSEAMIITNPDGTVGRVALGVIVVPDEG